MNDLADSIEGNVLQSLRQISSGNISVKADTKDKDDEISTAVNEAIETVNNVYIDVASVIGALKDGILNHRCDENKYRGNWKVLIHEVNALCDSVSRPI